MRTLPLLLVLTSLLAVTGAPTALAAEAVPVAEDIYCAPGYIWQTVCLVVGRACVLIEFFVGPICPA